MYLFNTILILTSALSFLLYGALCVFTDSLSPEFERYNLASLRKLIGFLEMAGGAGILAGFFNKPIQILSAFSLALLMICAVIVRIKIRDSFYLTLPALILLIVNIYITLI